MHGLGTIINTLAVLSGGLLGVALKSGLKERFQKILIQGCGIAVIFIGAAGTLQGMLKVEGNELSAQGAMLLIFSLVLGGLLGEALNVERRLDQVGERLRQAVQAKGDSPFVEGFVSSSLIICVGAMAIVGSIQDGLTGDIAMLSAKSVLDFVIVMVLASTFGVGVVFSALPLFLYQGTITLVAMLAGSFIGAELVGQLSYIGAAMVFCVGVNIAFGKRFKVGNLLPALLIPILYNAAATLLG